MDDSRLYRRPYRRGVRMNHHGSTYMHASHGYDDDDVILSDDRTDESHVYVTSEELAAALVPIHSALHEIMEHVGPHAQRHRARREAAILSVATAFVGSLGLGALALQHVDAAAIALIAVIVLAAVVGILVVVGRIQFSATGPGVAVNARAGTTDGGSQ